MSVGISNEKYEEAVMLQAYLASMKAELKTLLLEQIMPTIEVEVEKAASNAMNEMTSKISRWADMQYDQTRIVLDLRINGEVKESRNVT